MPIAKTIQARNVNVGDRILTSNGMREVLGKQMHSFTEGKLYRVTLTVDDISSPPWRSDLGFNPTDKVAVVRAPKEA